MKRMTKIIISIALFVSFSQNSYALNPFKFRIPGIKVKVDLTMNSEGMKAVKREIAWMRSPTIGEQIKKEAKQKRKEREKMQKQRYR